MIDKLKTKKTREELVNHLKKNKIGFGIHYRAINEMSYYKKKFKLNEKNFPASTYLGKIQ